MAKSSRTVIYAKVAADLDTNPKVRKAGALGRTVYEFILRRNAARGATGAVPIEDVDPDYMATSLMQPAADLEFGLRKAIEARLVAQEGEEIVISGWDDEWARTALNATERKRAERARKRGPDRDASRDVTPDVTSETAQTTDQPLAPLSRDVTASVTVTDQRDQIRSEEREPRAHARDPGPPTTLAVDEHARARGRLADRTWDRMNEIRVALATENRWNDVQPLNHQLHGHSELRARIRDAGADADRQCDHVMAVLEAEARRDKSVEWLCGKSFSPKGWERALAMRLADVNRSRGGGPSARPDPSERPPLED